MKVLLHDEHNKRYYAGWNKWVIEAEQGFDFGSIEKGALTKDQEKRSRVDVIVIAENRSRVIRLTANGPQFVS